MTRRICLAASPRDAIFAKVHHLLATLFLVTLLLAAHASAAITGGNYTTALNVSSLPAGQTAVLAIIFDAAPGFHAQSHVPLTKDYIPFKVELDANASLEFLDPIYPKGTIQNSIALGMQSVYTGRVIVYVPIRIKPAAAIGNTTISGTVTWQACNANTCFQPVHQPFNIATQIVPASQSVTSINTETFSGFDPSVFAKSATQASTTQPATVPAAESPASQTPPPTATTISFFGHSFSLAFGNLALALPIALAAGIIFNLMPCVLPVVPLKAIGFFEVSKHNRARCFLLGTVFSAGIIAFFAAIAVILVVFKGAVNFSWGQEFSKPIFVWPLVVVLIAMTLGMFGLFEVVVPEKLASFSPNHESVGGNFAFGVLAAVLSTPCTAPMLPGLLAWALAESMFNGVLCIIFVGVGMALPYLSLSAFPSLAKHVPRTGPWSLVLKQMMGFLLLATAVYFAGGRLVTGLEFLWAVAAVIITAMIFMVIRTIQLSGRTGPIVTAAIFALLISAISADIASGLTAKTDLDWQSYTPQALADARQAGKTVLVEFTANWCGNCIALEGTVYHDRAVISTLLKDNVLLLRADLTDENAPGQPLLNTLNPGGGIPLTAIYGRQHRDPVILTSLYTTSNLLSALEQIR